MSVLVAQVEGARRDDPNPVVFQPDTELLRQRGLQLEDSLYFSRMRMGECTCQLLTPPPPRCPEADCLYDNRSNGESGSEHAGH